MQTTNQQSRLAVCITGGAKLEPLAAKVLARAEADDSSAGVAVCSSGASAGMAVGRSGLTSDELAICAATGIDPEDFKATKAGEKTAHDYGLSAGEFEICQCLGVKPEDFIRTKASAA